jgi:peptide/nickel transport system ATP-binding protein
MEAVRATDLCVYGSDGAIVSGISFSITRGTTLGIVGESGSGKSLTAKTLSGLLPPGVSASGKVTIGDESVELPGTPAAWRQLRGRGVTLLLQDPFTSLSPSHRCGAQIGWGLRGPERTQWSTRE